MKRHDDFLFKFRKTPRPEFEQALLERLIEREKQMNVATITDRPIQEDNHAHTHTRFKSSQIRLIFAATIIVVLMFSVALAITNQPPDHANSPAGNNVDSIVPTSTPEPNDPQVPTNNSQINAQNAELLTRLASFGEGHLLNVAWSPDQSTLAVLASTGIYVYEADNLSEPQYHIDIAENLNVGLLQFSDDGSFLMYGSDAGLWLWDTEAKHGRRVDLESLDLGYVTNVALSPDKSVLVAGTSDGKLYSLDIESGTVKSTMSLPRDAAQLVAIDFNNDGTRLILATQFSPLSILVDPSAEWNNFQGESHMFGPDFHQVRNAKFSPNGDKIAVHLESEVVILDAVSGTELNRFEVVASDANGISAGSGDLTFSPDGTEVATFNNGQVLFWNVESGEARLMLFDPSDAISVVSFSPDFSQVALLSWKNMEMRIVDVATGDDIASLETFSSRPVTSVRFTPDGARLAVVADFNNNYILDLNDVEHPKKMLDNASVLGINVTLPVIVDPASGNVTTISNGEIHMFNPDTLDLVESWPITGGGAVLQPMVSTSPQLHGYTMTYSPNGRWLALGLSQNNMLLIYDMTSEERTPTVIPINGGYIGKLSFSADGTLLAMSVGPDMADADDQEYGITVFDVETWESINMIEVASNSAYEMAFHPQPGSTRLVIAEANYLQILDARTGERVQVLSDDMQVTGVDFNIDQALLVVAGHVYTDPNKPPQTHLRFYNVDDGALVAEFDHSLPIDDVRFSPDGTSLAIGTGAGTIELWGLGG